MKTLHELYTELANLYGAKNGEMVFTFSDKGSMHSYIDFYESYFKTKRNNVRLLEIGMMTGGSMHLWQKYFDTYELVGMDISPSWNQPREFQSSIEQDNNIKLLFTINSRLPSIPEDVKNKTFDFIIDDGDHSVQAQMETFQNYWPLVASGGTYFIEDVIGPSQIATLNNFLENYKDQITVDHYKGFKNNRNDDQILAITKL